MPLNPSYIWQMFMTSGKHPLPPKACKSPHLSICLLETLRGSDRSARREWGRELLSCGQNQIEMYHRDFYWTANHQESHALHPNYWAVRCPGGRFGRVGRSVIQCWGGAGTQPLWGGRRLAEPVLSILRISEPNWWCYSSRRVTWVFSSISDYGVWHFFIAITFHLLQGTFPGWKSLESQLTLGTSPKKLSTMLI